MIIIGCDYHPGVQQIAFVDTDTGEFQERELRHREEAEKFYRELATTGGKVRVGMEASGQARWFERLLGELNIELCSLRSPASPPRSFAIVTDYSVPLVIHHCQSSLRITDPLLCSGAKPAYRFLAVWLYS